MSLSSPSEVKVKPITQSVGVHAVGPQGGFLILGIKKKATVEIRISSFVNSIHGKRISAMIAEFEKKSTLLRNA